MSINKDPKERIRAAHGALSKAFNEFVVGCVDAVGVDAAASMIMIEISGLLSRFTDSQMAALRMVYEEVNKEGK